MQSQRAAREAGIANEGYASRRLASPGLRKVQAPGDLGAVEEGHHNFFERQADGSWKMTGGGRCIQIWKWVTDRFLLDESISIVQAATLEYPPADIDNE